MHRKNGNKGKGNNNGISPSIALEGEEDRVLFSLSLCEEKFLMIFFLLNQQISLVLNLHKTQKAAKGNRNTKAPYIGGNTREQSDTRAAKTNYPLYGLKSCHQQL